MKDHMEKRVIKVSSKRQFTIPKVYMDYLQNPEKFEAYLTEDGILLKPITKKFSQSV